MEHKTNQLEKTVLFSNENYQRIAQDFWVYKFTTANPSYQYSLIDDLKQDLPNVKSVVYLQGKAFYALFEKAKFKNDFELEGKIKSVINGSEEVQFSQITNLRDENEIDKRHLAQLLLNSLATTSTKNAKCSNITGSLYWIVKTENSKDESKKPYISKYVTLKLELDYHLHLQLGVETFTSIYLKKYMDFKKTKFEKLPKYEITSGSIRTMKRIKFSTKDENRTDVYVQRQVGKKNNVTFLDFSDWNSFETSKSGVLYLFLKEVQEQLSKYITIKFVELPFSQEKTEFDKKLSDNVKARIKAFYQSKPIVINIADSLKDNQEANQLAQDLQTFLTDQEREYKAKNITFGDLSESALNIRIIRSEKNYDRDNDEHCNKYQNGKFKNYLVHHITTDDFDIELEKTKKGETKKLLSSPAIDVILKESYIKNDIKQGKITILDWTFGEWLFMGKEEIKEENQSSKDKKYAFHLLKVLENGNLEFTTCLPDQVFSNSDYERLKSIYQTYDKFNGREFLNCLLVSNHQDINLIFETPRFTIQDIEKIGETLELEAQETELQKSQVLAILEKFVVENQSFASDEKLLNTTNRLKNFRYKISKDELNNLFEEQGLNNRTKIKKAFCDFYYQNSEQFLGKKDVLHHFFKGKEEIEELFASNTNIYYQDENSTEAFYFVGVVPKQIQTSFQNATNIRKIKAVKNLKGQQSQLIFDQLLQTMAVDFVKQGSLTVLPFPFKYLREIQK